MNDEKNALLGTDGALKDEDLSKKDEIEQKLAESSLHLNAMSQRSVVSTTFVSSIPYFFPLIRKY